MLLYKNKFTVLQPGDVINFDPIDCNITITRKRTHLGFIHTGDRTQVLEMPGGSLSLALCEAMISFLQATTTFTFKTITCTPQCVQYRVINQLKG